MKTPENVLKTEGENQGEAAPRGAAPEETAGKLSPTSKRFFELNKDFLENYAGDSSLQIKPSPKGLGTFAVDLEKGVLYAEPRFFGERGHGTDETMVLTLHEYEHFREMRELLSEKGGEQVWRKHIAKFKAKKRFSIMDNCFDDVKINRTVVSRAPSLLETRRKLWAEKMFPDADFSSLPKHIQFCYALDRKLNVSDEQVKVSEEVQAELDKLEAIKNSAGVSVLDYASDPRTPMSVRLKLQELYLEPILEKLFEEDVKDKEDKGKGGEGSEGEGEESTDESEGEESGEKDSGDEKKKPKSKPKKGGKTGKEKPKNPEDYFRDEYNKWDKEHPETVSWKDIERATEEFIKNKKGEKSAEQLAEEAYAKAEGVTAEELREYRRFRQTIEEIKNPETDESVVEKLRKIFRKIVAERKKRVPSSKLPVAEGEILIYPAEAVVQIQAGVREPEVWQTIEQKERPKELYGNFDAVLVFDRSGSMDEGGKKKEQRKCGILGLEALKEFSDLIDEERADLQYDLNVRTEAWTFGDDAQVEMLKPLGKEMTERQRVLIYKTLANTPGDSTKDFLALEKIFAAIPEEDWEKIRRKELRKIIVVFSDGESDNSAKVQEICGKFRERGTVVVGVGITNSGKAAETTYAPDGQVCEDASKLAVVLGGLLEKFIRELNQNQAG